MHRWALWIALLGLGCGEEEPKLLDTGPESDTDTDTDTDTEPVNDCGVDIPLDHGGGSDVHPLVPTQYAYLWQTRGCTTTDGGPGISVYRTVMADEGSVDSSGVFTAVERWYWFYGGDWEDDCVDAFLIEGAVYTGDPGTLGCAECDASFEVSQEPCFQTCSESYYSLLGLDEAPTSEEYSGGLMFDTVTPSGNPNMDNRMLVVRAGLRPDGDYSLDIDYAPGHIYPTGEDYTWPASYDWIGMVCLPVP